MTSATARAYPNIALVKYWGKADEEMIVPVAGSLSMTLDDFPTTTTVTLNPSAETADSFCLNGTEQSAEESARVVAFLEIVRALAADHGSALHQRSARVVSTNEGPTAAGMASSASGYAALALAASTAYGLQLDTTELSRLARRGSGSACRSVVDRFAVWNAGTDDASSYAEPVAAPEMAMIAVTVATAQKKVSSRAGMRATAETSPYYPEWITTTEQTLEKMKAACATGDFRRIGQLAETHAMRMHAVIQASDPSIRYLAPRSLEIFDAVAQLREEGFDVYATADAGPNVVVMAEPMDAGIIAQKLAHLDAKQAPKVLLPGPGAQLVAETASDAEGATA